MASLDTDAANDWDESGNSPKSDQENFKSSDCTNSDEPNQNETADINPDAAAPGVKIDPLIIIKIDTDKVEINKANACTPERVKKPEDIKNTFRDKNSKELQVSETPERTSASDTDKSENVETSGDVAENLKEAEDIINKIVENINPKTSYVINKLQLEPEVEKALEERDAEEGNPFHLKCFLFHRDRPVALIRSLKHLVREKDKEVLLKLKKAITSFFIFFFYRNVIYEENGKEMIRPEIFAALSGYAGILDKFADINFTANIERRLCKFPFKQVQTSMTAGSVRKRNETARSGQDIVLDVWAFLDVIIGNRTRELREQASIYKLKHFCTSKGEPLADGKPLFDIKENSLKVRRSFTLPQLGQTLMHFSRIHMGQTTCKLGTSEAREEETDTPEFQMQECIREVTSQELQNALNEELYKVMEKSMQNVEKTSIYLDNTDIGNWIKAEKITLHAQKRGNKKRSLIIGWYWAPTLDEVLGYLRDKCDSKFNHEWLDQVKIKFNRKSHPLKKFIFSRFDFHELGTYIYYYGTWLEITAQYLYLIESNFTQLLSDSWIEASNIYLMPWKWLKGERKKCKKGHSIYFLQDCKFQEAEETWKRHFQRACIEEEFENVKECIKEIRLSQKEMSEKKPYLRISDKITKDKDNPFNIAAHLYLLHECRMMEEDFNASHALLDTLLKDSEWNMITCDQKEPHGIELCDILIWNENITYLVHVKLGFTASAMRDVCSQIRNAADHIYRNQMSAKGTHIIDIYWDMLIADSQKGFHQVAAKTKLENMGPEKFKALFDNNKKDIVFVLACRDDNKKEDLKTTIAKTKTKQFKFMVNREDEIKESLTPNFPEPLKVVEKLKDQGYLTEDGNLTDKFILDGKDNKTKFVETIKKWKEVGSLKKAQALFEILNTGLSKSKSTVARMEIIRLCRDFRSYRVGQKQFLLKITSIDRDYPV